MRKKLFKPIILVTLLCIVIVCSAFAFAGCSLFSSMFSRWEFSYREFNINNDHLNMWDDGTDGYVLEINTDSATRRKISKIENIPTEYNGKPVVQVDFNYTAVTDLVIPDGIKYVRLYGCKSLKNLTLPKTLRSLYEADFSNCSSLESITIPDSVVGIGPYVFANCTSLKSIKLPASLSEISMLAFSSDYETDCALYTDSNNWVDGAFYLDNHLISAGNNVGASYTVKEGTVTICSNAFKNSKGSPLLYIESVDLPKSLKYIGKSAFGPDSTFGKIKEVYYSGSISEWCAIKFENETSNPVYSFYKGNSNRLGEEGYETKLYCVDEGKDTLVETVNLPFRATTVNDYALAGFSCLKHFNMVGNPTSHVKYLGKSAFEGCVNLNSVTLGSEIEEIGEGAFSECRNLNNVRIYSERYKSFEYTSEDESTWMQYNCIIDVEEKRVIAFTSKEIYIPLFVESIDETTLAKNMTLVRYEGTKEQWTNIKNIYHIR
ncbi:MAG: leucine-rich repeat domain-containing protein, partial [Clostridia bacterium]|nr:leucine-rich repeat domain-containing protein [Clostridia bacterium]